MKIAGVALIASVAVTHSMQAQERLDPLSLKPAGSGTIVGFVADTALKALDDTELFVPSLRRKLRGRPDGHFRFEDVKPGVYEVAARRLGYYPQVRTVTVGSEGGIAAFELLPFPRSLPPVVTAAPRGGISGLVNDTKRRALTDVDIHVVSSSNVRTDSNGSFFAPVKAGKYIVVVKHRGFASQIVGVTVPKDSGRRISFWLKPSSHRALAMEETAIMELPMRLNRRNPVQSALFTREDIEKKGWTELSQVAGAGAGRPVDPACTAFVDGGPRREYIWALWADDVEAVEVYRGGNQTLSVTNIRTGETRQIANTRATDCADKVIVWLRK